MKDKAFLELVLVAERTSLGRRIRQFSIQLGGKELEKIIAREPLDVSAGAARYAESLGKTGEAVAASDAVRLYERLLARYPTMMADISDFSLAKMVEQAQGRGDQWAESLRGLIVEKRLFDLPLTKDAWSVLDNVRRAKAKRFKIAWDSPDLVTDVLDGHGLAVGDMNLVSNAMLVPPGRAKREPFAWFTLIGESKSLNVGELARAQARGGPAPVGLGPAQDTRRLHPWRVLPAGQHLLRAGAARRVGGEEGRSHGQGRHGAGSRADQTSGVLHTVRRLRPREHDREPDSPGRQSGHPNRDVAVAVHPRGSGQVLPSHRRAPRQGLSCFLCTTHVYRAGQVSARSLGGLFSEAVGQKSIMEVRGQSPPWPLRAILARMQSGRRGLRYPGRRDRYARICGEGFAPLDLGAAPAWVDPDRVHKG